MLLGEKIKCIRKKFNLTQEQLAEKLNISRQAVAKWEMDNGIPDTDNLKSISKLFGISIDTLLEDKADITISVLNQEINLQQYGKNKGEQYLNILNKNFDNTWEIYILSNSKKITTIGGLIDLITFGISKLEDLSPYFLAVKEDTKLLINIKTDLMEIKHLNSNIDIKKFELNKKLYTNYGKLKR